MLAPNQEPTQRVFCEKKTEDEKYCDTVPLKGLSHEISGPVYWPVWMHIGLNKNSFWFLNFKEAPSI
jgi:hypothetical protein